MQLLIRPALLDGLAEVSMKNLPSRVRIYVLIVIAMAAAFLGWQWFCQPLWLDSPAQIVRFLCGVGLVAIATMRPIGLPRSAHISLGSVFGFAAICLFSPAFGTILYLLGLVLGYVFFQWRHRKWTWYQVLFNVAVQTLSVGAGALVYLLLHQGDISPVISLVNASSFVLGGLCFVLLNGLLVALVIGLVERVPPWQVMSTNWHGSFIQFVSHVPLAGIIMLLYQSRPWAVLLILLPLVAIERSYSNAELLLIAARNTLELVATLVDARDPATARHSRRVTEYAAIIAKQMRVSLSLQEGLVWAAMIHDVGKLTIPEALLLKQEGLSPGEWERMHRHPVIGAHLIENLPRFELAREIIRYHHERFDGEGYPEGRAGEDIPLGARILAVADTLDAMTSERPYRRPSTLDQALAEIHCCAGTQFDPRVVDALLAARSTLEGLFSSVGDEQAGEILPLAGEVDSLPVGTQPGHMARQEGAPGGSPAPGYSPAAGRSQEEKPFRGLATRR